MSCHTWLSVSSFSLSLRSNGFSVILRAAAARTRQVVTHAPLGVSPCCISIRNFKIRLDGADAAPLWRDESDVSQLMSNGKEICMRARSAVFVRRRAAG